MNYSMVLILYIELNLIHVQSQLELILNKIIFDGTVVYSYHYNIVNEEGHNKIQSHSQPIKQTKSNTKWTCLAKWGGYPIPSLPDIASQSYIKKNAFFPNIHQSISYTILLQSALSWEAPESESVSYSLSFLIEYKWNIRTI